MALLSRDDAAHAACLAAFGSIRGQLLTSEAVLTEAMHLLGRRPPVRARASNSSLDFAKVGGVPVRPGVTHAEIPG